MQSISRKTTLSESVKRYFKLGTVGRRKIYEASKRVLIRGHLGVRRRAARELAAHSTFTIPGQRGFLAFGPDAFEDTPLMVRDAVERLNHIDPKLKHQPRTTTQGLFVHLLNSFELTLGSPYVQFILRPQIVAAVSNYLGAIPVLAQIDLWYSEHHPVLNNSQFYHCDWSASRQVKIFLHCSDVGPDNGPLTVVEADKSEDIRRRLRYDFNRHGRRYRVSDEQMAALGGAEHAHALTGPAGTMFFADTSRCFHFGSRLAPGAAPRVMILFQLLPPSSFQLPLDFRLGAPFRRLVRPELPEYQRLLLGGA